MAKKIRLDFSKVEERSGYNQRQMPEGLYEAKVTSLEQRDAQDGTAMLVYGIRPTSPKYATRNFPNYCKLQQNQLWKLRDLFIAAGETIPKKATQLDPEKIIGAKIAIEIGDGTGQYTDRSEIVSVYPLNILDELSDDSDDEDDEDETDEEFEDGDEDLDEDDEDEDDEELDDEELEDDEDEDDEDEDDEELDDEELEDDEDEDDEEEEEPEPAPKKRAAKKAPAKAPAKAASKPAAKRTVKRSR